MIYFGLWTIVYCTCLLGMSAVKLKIYTNDSKLKKTTHEFIVYVYFQTLFVDAVNFTQFFVCTIIILLDVSLFCLFGHDTTTAHDEIFHTICSHWQWYEFPFGIKKVIPIILMNAQQPVYVKGYIGVYCTRGFIKSVCKDYDSI